MIIAAVLITIGIMAKGRFHPVVIPIAMSLFLVVVGITNIVAILHMAAVTDQNQETHERESLIIPVRDAGNPVISITKEDSELSLFVSGKEFTMNDDNFEIVYTDVKEAKPVLNIDKSYVDVPWWISPYSYRVRTLVEYQLVVSHNTVFQIRERTKR